MLDKITVARAKGAILWLIGEYCDKVPWLIGEYCDKVPKIAPDVLRKAAKVFIQEASGKNFAMFSCDNLMHYNMFFISLIC